MAATGGPDPCEWETLRAGYTPRPQGPSGDRKGLDQPRTRQRTGPALNRPGGTTFFARLCPEPPSASLNCGGAVSWGGTVTCQLSVSAGWSYTVNQWRFTSGPVSVVGPTTGTSWEGSVVVSGEVRVELALAGNDTVVTASVEVTRRPNWRWSSADWSFSQGTAPLPTGPIGDVVVGSTLIAGWNCTPPDCVRGFILPDIPGGESGGYTTTSVQGNGPNGGVHYVTSADFQSSRASNLHPNLKGGQTWQLSPSQQAQCNGAQALTWLAANACLGNSVASAWLAAAWEHEGFGYSGDGHQAHMQAAAATLGNDPEAQLEPLVGQDAQELAMLISIRLALAGNNIINSHNEPSSNHPGGSVWAWHPTSLQFVVVSFGPI